MDRFSSFLLDDNGFLDVKFGNWFVCCFGVCIARVDIFDCLLFVDFARDDINVVGNDLVGCGVREIIDGRWNV